METIELSNYFPSTRSREISQPEVRPERIAERSRTTRDQQKKIMVIIASTLSLMIVLFLAVNWIFKLEYLPMQWNSAFSLGE